MTLFPEARSAAPSNRTRADTDTMRSAAGGVSAGDLSQVRLADDDDMDGRGAPGTRGAGLSLARRDSSSVSQSSQQNQLGIADPNSGVDATGVHRRLRLPACKAVTDA